MLQVALRAQDQRLRGSAWRQSFQVLAGQAVQPREPVRAGDLDDAAVGAVDEDLAFDHRALLARGVAVVRGDPFVRPGGLDGSVNVKHVASLYSSRSARTPLGAPHPSRIPGRYPAP